jgi:hypothetical protein
VSRTAGEGAETGLRFFSTLGAKWLCRTKLFPQVGFFDDIQAKSREPRQFSFSVRLPGKSAFAERDRSRVVFRLNFSAGACGNAAQHF